MPFYILLFLSGDLFLQQFRELPSTILIGILLLTNIIISIKFKKYQRFLFVGIAFLSGLFWTTWYANSIKNLELPHELEGKPLTITGYVASIPKTDEWQTSFIFALKKIQMNEQILSSKTNIRLMWRNPNQQIKIGQKWQLVVRLKRIHTPQNPGTFDYEAWTFQQGLRAHGYIIAGSNNRLLSHHWYHFPLGQFREYLLKKINNISPQSMTSVWLGTLIVGEHQNVSQTMWDILRATGTNHLMAIAGLHIGMLTSFVYLIINFCWRQFPKLMLRTPAQIASSYAAAVACVCYSALAGFSMPTMRACIMLLIFLLSRIAKLSLSTWNVWSCALLSVLLINPLSVLEQSFWLSFLTIALIIYGMNGRLSVRNFWWKWGRVQWVIAVGLAPLSFFLFQETSIIGFFANSISIPWLEFFILPFCLLSVIFIFISESLAHLFLWIADKNLEYLWKILTWFSKLPINSFHLAILNPLMLFALVCAIFILLLPKSFPGKWLSAIWFALAIFIVIPKPKSGDFWLTLLDVGQGLAIVVQTQNHLLVYDTGPRLNEKVDAGQNVLVPYLRKINAKYIDKVIISHADNDHIGGFLALAHAFKIHHIYTSVPQKISLPSIYCEAQKSWQWDNVQFSFLYPSHDAFNLGNNSSCVLMIRNKNKSVLLTGDIEKLAENNLLHAYQHQLSAQILVAPHHGSKTSAPINFVNAVAPQIVLYATGYRNRYHFPNESVLTAYNQLHAQQLNTADTGAIFVKLEKDKSHIPIFLYRQEQQRFWYDH